MDNRQLPLADLTDLFYLCPLNSEDRLRLYRVPYQSFSLCLTGAIHATFINNTINTYDCRYDCGILDWIPLYCY
jgi:hypothetical protein